MNEAETYKNEAEIIGIYLLSKKPGETEKEIYADAMKKLKIELDEKEKKIWFLIMKYPFLMGSVDAALAFKNPHGNIRRKIFTMLAILETSPENVNYFLSDKFSFFVFIKIIFSGIRSILRIISGYIILFFL